MSNERVAGNIKLAGLDDLLGVNNDSSEGLTYIPVEELHDFRNHPFKVIDNADMEELVNSIREQGILVPIIARKRKNDGYEIISGHRRRHAAKLAGLTEIPARIVEADNDKAVLIMVDSNIQRENLLPSEKARACKMRFEAMKHQGSRGGGMSCDEIGKDLGESGKTIQRLVKAAELPDKFLDLMDSKRFGLLQAVNLADISLENLNVIYEIIKDKKISVKQTKELKNISAGKKLSVSDVKEVLTDKNKPEKKVNVVIKEGLEYIPKEYSMDMICELVNYLLIEWGMSQNKEA